MTFQFRTAVRTETSLLIGIAGASGSGKTFSGLRLATGLAGDGKIAVIDTEAGRALHYADRFKFEHGDLKPPFTPESYMEAIAAADAAGFRAIMIDSFSHEWEGEGGLLEIHQQTLEELATDDRTGKVEKWKLDKMSAPAWNKPKQRHKRLVNKLLQCRAHLIFCLRAEEKIRFEKIKDDRGHEKTAIVPAGWIPITEKRFMFEMTTSMTMLPDQPGVPVPIKIQEQHRFAFPEGQRVDEGAGKRLAAWARGQTRAGEPEHGGGNLLPAAAVLSADQLKELGEEAAMGGMSVLRTWFKGLTKPEQLTVEPLLDGLKAKARTADEEAAAREAAASGEK
jgi:hypothetical protein